MYLQGFARYMMVQPRDLERSLQELVKKHLLCTEKPKTLYAATGLMK